MIIKILATLGFLISIYSLYVKIKKENNKNYKPICDINKNISCTKAFLSNEGSLIGLPNPLFGIFFYIIIFVLEYLNIHKAIFYFSLLAFLGSLSLAYVSYVKQKNFCIVCTSIYIINALLWFFSWQKFII